jgi:CubicO group peptidase (beta-lactamase class C family)
VPVDRFARPRDVLQSAVEAHAFPAAVVEVGRRAGAIWGEAFGRLSTDLDAAPASADTIFDLASLTKVIATSSIAMRHVDEGRLGLEDPVSRWLPAWRGTDRDQVTIEDLLSHSAGLTGYLPYFRDLHGRAEFEAAICLGALEYVPRSRSIYSDLGFILLGFILEDAGRAPLDRQFRAVSDLVLPEPLGYAPPRAWRPIVAPTEIDAWRGRLLVGEVHDENAWALGGVAGHAGLFGTAAAVGAFARLVLAALASDDRLARHATARRFATRTRVPGSSRGLGWDTMLPTSSCGRLMSESAIGHTGFTGTSLWIDPEKDVYVVLLTNRVHPTRENDAILRIRPAVHDAIMSAMEDQCS